VSKPRCEVVSENGRHGEAGFCRYDCKNPAVGRYRVEHPDGRMLERFEMNGADLAVCGTHRAYFKRHGYRMTELSFFKRWERVIKAL
jgi:hypothetical protein